MKHHIWATIGRWLLVAPSFMLSLLAAEIALMYSIVLDQSWLAWAQAWKLGVPPSVLLDILDPIVFFAILAIWTIPTVFTVGFALRKPKADRVQWGLTLVLLLETAFVWGKTQPGFVFAHHIAAVSAAIVSVCGLAFSFRAGRRARAHFLANSVTFALLMLPSLMALAATLQQPPNPQKIWSTVLEKGTWQAMNTGSSFAATRQMVFAGDRVLAIFDAGSAGYDGKQPMSKYRLVSMSVTTGEIKNSHEFVGHWGAMPSLFATNDGHVVLQNGNLKSLNPDLTMAGLQLDIDNNGRVLQISPDGSTMAWETYGKDSGTVLIDSHTLAPVGKHLAQPAPVSISATAALTSNTYWYREYPKDRSFVTFTDEQGQRLLFHGDCGGQPAFLSNETVLLIGCGKVSTLNLQGAVLKQAVLDRGAEYAGSSQNGKYFALQFSDERGDPQVLLYEYFIIYDVATLRPVALVPISDMPERQSWSAISPDGQLFAVGNPNELSLYRLP